jgi:hypothetical protein
VGSPTTLATITVPLFLGDELGNVSAKRISQSASATIISPPFLEIEWEMDKRRMHRRVERKVVIVQDVHTIFQRV